MTQQAGVELLLGIQASSPAKVQDGLGARGQRVPCPQPNRARSDAGVKSAPVDVSALLLHHPERALGLKAAHERVPQAGDVRIANVICEDRLDAGGHVKRGSGFSMARWVGTHRDQIQWAGKIMVIQIGELTHKIGSDDLALGDMRLERGNLELLVGDECVRGESIVVKNVTGIGFGDGEVWRIDFAPITIGLAPKDRAPGLVESINRFVSSLLASGERRWRTSRNSSVRCRGNQTHYQSASRRRPGALP